MRHHPRHPSPGQGPGSSALEWLRSPHGVSHCITHHSVQNSRQQVFPDAIQRRRGFNVQRSVQRAGHGRQQGGGIPGRIPRARRQTHLLQHPHGEINPEPLSTAIWTTVGSGATGILALSVPCMMHQTYGLTGGRNGEGNSNGVWSASRQTAEPWLRLSAILESSPGNPRPAPPCEPPAINNNKECRPERQGERHWHTNIISLQWCDEFTPGRTSPVLRS